MKKWHLEEVLELFDMPFNDLLFKAHTIHRENFDPNEIQLSTLYNIKTGSCPENCSYCSQSAHFNTGLKKEPLKEIKDVLEKAQAAKANGSSRFCIGAAWRGPKDGDLDRVIEMVKEVKKMGLETCVTLGLLKKEQAEKLKEAGLDYYNHNIDTSESHYDKIITTRTFADRLETIQHVSDAGINVCCGGILGLGETVKDRAEMLLTLANMETPPKSVPINQLMQVPGTPLYGADSVDPIDFIRTIAVARILMPTSYVRLSAGRTEMSKEVQALCFFAGANSTFSGDQLLTADNPGLNEDALMFEKLGMVRI
ncbi:biotin synthase BioB [Candidatus Odyssella acanthamoebae]|uniref:Biotin synthase n=1 Tax=Candidatus Odyssella acanthamoebae TaxID=91604 RepID=A0A077AUZ3_9PROT|nr:biotin synthase BioB [Candidatus Paracaedibacter acanthamoebae]AIK95859.1 biotin synthase [Candidatus Paracaedibacter acanthamoebae]